LGLAALLAAAFAMGLALPAAAQQRAPRELASDEIDWIRPSANEMSRYYPVEATNKKISGWAVVQCRIRADGLLKDCKLLGESPTGLQFGEMSLRMSRLFRVRPKSAEVDLLPGDIVTLPIIMSPLDGRGPPPVNYIAGRPSKLLTIAEQPGPRTFACVAARPEVQCEAHDFSWDDTPLLDATAALVRSAPVGAERTTLNCGLDAARHLAGCKAIGGDAAQTAAMLGLAELFVAPAEAQDKTPMAKGRIVIEFDWPALRAALDAGILTATR
jgi:hypothetical protein